MNPPFRLAKECRTSIHTTFRRERGLPTTLPSDEQLVAAQKLFAHAQVGLTKVTGAFALAASTACSRGPDAKQLFIAALSGAEAPTLPPGLKDDVNVMITGTFDVFRAGVYVFSETSLKPTAEGCGYVDMALGATVDLHDRTAVFTFLFNVSWYFGKSKPPFPTYGLKSFGGKQDHGFPKPRNMSDFDDFGGTGIIEGGYQDFTRYSNGEINMVDDNHSALRMAAMATLTAWKRACQDPDF